MRWTVLVLFVGVTGCGRVIADRAYGELRVIHTVDGVVIEQEEPVIDFGPVGFGTTATQRLFLRNTGRAPMSIDRIEAVSGSVVVIGPDAVASDGFALRFERVVLAPGELRELLVLYAPLIDRRSVDEAQVALHLSGAVNRTTTMVLRGVGIPIDCGGRPSLDFGGVARGETATLSMQFQNTSAFDAAVTVGGPPQPLPAFALAPGTTAGAHIIPPGGALRIDVTFSPGEARDYFGLLPLAWSSECSPGSVRLVGTGVDSPIAIAPSVVDFGLSRPGFTRTGSVTFQNLLSRVVMLTGLATFDGAALSSRFSVAEADGGTPPELSLPPATRAADGTLAPGTRSLLLAFRPTALGPANGVLRAQTNVRSNMSLAVPLRGFGGGPVLSLSPPPVLDPRVAYFPGATPPSFTLRTVTVRNDGTGLVPPSPGGNLHFGVGGAPVGVVAGANASVAELCVGRFDESAGTCVGTLDGYDADAGLSPGEALDIPVRITPAGIGLKEWTVTLYSNDQASPGTPLQVRAEAVQLPPCNFTVTPVALDFGSLRPPATRDLDVEVVNQATNAGSVCFVEGPEAVGAGFSLVSAPVFTELQPQQRLRLTVRAAPTVSVSTPTVVTGTLRARISNPTAATMALPLEATVTP